MAAEELLVGKRVQGVSRGPVPAGPALQGLAAFSLCILLPSLATSSANVALPTLARALGASFSEVQWIVLAYLLAVTTLTVTAGRLGDLAGRRALLLAGISLFTTASVLCSIAPALSFLIAARALQGLGAAMMMALSMALVGQTIPKERIGSAMGLLGTMSAIGTALGPSLGGVLISGFGWPAIFLVNGPLGLLTLFLVHRSVAIDRPSPHAARPGFDRLGTLLLGLTLAAYALAMTVGRTHFGAIHIALLLLALLGLGLFLLAESRTASPLIPLVMFRQSGFSACLVMSALVSTVMMSTLVVGPFYLSRALALDTASIGLIMSVGPVVAALAGWPSGRVVDRFGTSSATVAGLAGISLGAFLLSTASPSLGVAGYLAPTVLATAGYALFQAANNTALLADIRPDQRGVVAGLLNLARNLGLITGASVMGAVFALASGIGEITTAQPAAVVAGMRITFLVAAILILAALGLAFLSRAALRHPAFYDCDSAHPGPHRNSA